jgi:hypothetical protein
MLVVPIYKDTIKTKDGVTYKVIEYTNFKEGGPAVYARGAGDDTNTLVYFIDIDEINGTKVEFQKGSKVFNALGKVKRAEHLPQPNDEIVVLSDKITNTDDKQTVEVDTLKLKSKALGVNKGLFIKSSEGDSYRLKQILDIKRDLGGSGFNRDNFLKIYKDYTGV